VDYYNRAGRAVYACARDLSKAFDLVSWEMLFSELLERGVSPCNKKRAIFISKIHSLKGSAREK